MENSKENATHWQNINRAMNIQARDEERPFVPCESLLFFDEDDASSITLEVDTSSLSVVAGVHFVCSDPSEMVEKLREARQAFDDAIKFFANFSEMQQELIANNNEDYIEWHNNLVQPLSPMGHFDTNY